MEENSETTAGKSSSSPGLVQETRFDKHSEEIKRNEEDSKQESEINQLVLNEDSGIKSSLCMVGSGNREKTSVEETSGHEDLVTEDLTAHKKHSQKEIELSEINIDNHQEVYATQAFGSNFLFTLDQKETNLPPSFVETLKKTSEIFANEILQIENGKIEKVENSCKSFILALKETIFNIKVVLFDFLKTIRSIYCEYHSEKQTIITELLNNELESLETALNMPKIKKQLFNDLDLETTKIFFISKFFTLDSIDFNELFEEFKKTFKPFLNKKELSMKIFDNFMIVYKQSLHKHYLKFFDILNQAASTCWQNSKNKMVFIKLREITSNSLQTSELTAVQLLLSDCKVKISSITRLSDEKTLVILKIDKSSYFIICLKSGSHIIKVLEYNNCICAEGSNETSLFIFNKTTNAAAIYLFDGLRLNFFSDFEIKLGPKEKITSIVYLSSGNERILFTSTSCCLSQIFDRNPRISVNLKTKLAENDYKLSLCYSRKMIFLASNQKVRLFNEFLVQVYEVDIEFSFNVIGFVLSSVKALNIVGTRGSKISVFPTTVICESHDFGLEIKDDKGFPDDRVESITIYTSKTFIDDYFSCNHTNYFSIMRKEYLLDSIQPFN